MNAIIICEHQLPIPRENLEEDDELKFDLIQWDEHEFYSFSFSQTLNLLDLRQDRFTISEDGQLYKHLVEIEFFEDESETRQIREVDKGIERQDYTGEIIFHTLFMGKKHDYWIEFKSLFWKGDMKELELLSHEKHSNKARLKSLREYKKAIKEQSKLLVKKNIIFHLLGWMLYLIVTPISLVFKLSFVGLVRIERWIYNLRR